MSDISLTIAGAARRVYGFDKVWLSIATGLALGVMFVPGQTWSSLDFTVDALLHIGPFFALSICLAAYA